MSIVSAVSRPSRRVVLTRPGCFAPEPVAQPAQSAHVGPNIEQGAVGWMEALTPGARELAESFLAEVMGSRGIRGYLSPGFTVVRVGRKFEVRATDAGARYMAFESDPLDGRGLGQIMKGRWE